MPKRIKLTPFTVLVIACAAIILVGGIMLIADSRTDARIAADNARYRELRDATVPPAQPTATPVPTPDDGTVRIGLPTEPPRDENYAMLSAINPDFCGWLRGGDIDLPVVHREADNATYLSTSFSGEESIGGTLFMDGFNRLYPADTLTVIYGHNMKSGDMFGRLSRYGDPEYLLDHPILHFDTVFSPGRYVPFAAFTARAADVDIRQFQPSVDEFNALADLCLDLSAFDHGVDVRYGDTLLALVTCDGDNDDERFFLLCRQLRPGESEMDIAVMLDRLSEN